MSEAAAPHKKVVSLRIALRSNRSKKERWRDKLAARRARLAGLKPGAYMMKPWPVACTG
jgi:hypothetical protein